MSDFKPRNIDIFTIHSMYEDAPEEERTTLFTDSKGGTHATAAARATAQAQIDRKEKFKGLGGGNPTDIASIRGVKARGRSSLRTAPALNIKSGSGIAIKGYA